MTQKAPAGDQRDLRQGNLAAIMAHLRQHTLLSRRDLAQLTGLNPATITRLVRELIAAGLVRETGTHSSHTGRPSIYLSLNLDAGAIIGGELEERLKLRVFVDNVASTSALGESYLGAARDYNNVLYRSTQGGLEGRFVINGNILRGVGGFTGCCATTSQKLLPG